MRRTVVLTWLLGCVSILAQTSAAIWIDVPFVSQPREGCGAASLSMVMQYWAGKQGTAASSDSDVTQIQHQLFSRKEHGIPAEQMRAYMLKHGFEAYAFSGKWSDIEEQIGKGRPLIVAIKPEGQSELHYVVIDGIDSEHGLVTMNDPAVRKLLNEERAQFEKEWAATHNWTLLAVPASSSR